MTVKEVSTENPAENSDWGGPNIIWVAASKLSVVWIESQQPAKKGWSKHIADRFDWQIFGLLSVSLPFGKDGIRHIIDGQNRRSAAVQLFGPDVMLPCQELNAIEPVEAARLFDQLNTERRGVSAVDKFLVRVTAQMPVETAVHEIVRDNGYKIGPNASPDMIRAVSALLVLYRRTGPDTLNRTLGVLKDIWPDEVIATDAPILTGVGTFLAKYPDIDIERLKSRLEEEVTPSRLLARGRGRRDNEGGSIGANVAAIITTIYNRSLPASTRLV